MKKIAARDPPGRYLDRAPVSGFWKKQAWVVLSDREASKRIKECLTKTLARYKKRYPERAAELLKNRKKENSKERKKNNRKKK